MTDNTQKPTEGFFKLEQLDINGKILDTFEDHNMIMKLSKATVAASTKGDTVYNSYINTFVLGNGGSVSGDLLTAKTFSYENTNLFAEQNLSDGLTSNISTFPITFDPTNIDPNTGAATVLDEGSVVGEVQSSTTEINILTIDDSSIVYTIVIPTSNANGSGAEAWTEAALYTKESEDLASTPKKLGKIFAMRTFPAKIKDDTTSFKITWKIIF